VAMWRKAAQADAMMNYPDLRTLLHCNRHDVHTTLHEPSYHRLQDQVNANPQIMIYLTFNLHALVHSMSEYRACMLLIQSKGSVKGFLPMN